KSQRFRPRLCTLEKGDNGYGFHLHGERGKSGQFIRLVEPDSPAETSGLRAGDRLVLVNGADVEGESHQQVVSRMRRAGRLELVVVDPDTELLLRKLYSSSVPALVTVGLPMSVRVLKGAVGDGVAPRESTPLPESNGGIQEHVEKLSVSSEKEASPELRPRLCVIQRGSNGYGFNLHSERARPGQYIRAVDEDSPAESAGLQPKDRIVEVNGIPVEGKTHSEVVAAIKVGGNVTRLLVVDPETEAFFKRCGVAPTLDHLSGPLPEPVVNGEMEEKVNGRGATEPERNSKLSVSPSPSNASSNTSLGTPTANTPPESQEPSSRRITQSDGVTISAVFSFFQGLLADTIPALNMSLQQVKELAHQKRSNKRAPPMDWTKKNELFSNL
uniref:Na(+)/H(+) exchange regulatory cofactor NHE-RF n=1 Tax=Tetraodon nigroviridis TaxID=99883 RepID=H3D1Z9_TETNG